MHRKRSKLLSEKSALSQKFHINSNQSRKSDQKMPTLDEMMSGIISQDRFTLARAITMVESDTDQYVDLVDALLERCWQLRKPTIKIGITGAPGVGKSTFLDAIIKEPLAKGKRIAIITTDPSSTVSGGSILGDKTRMSSGSQHPNCFIRSTPSRGQLGGLNDAAHKTAILCAAAGYDYVMVESVGVGQSEIQIEQLVDINLLLLSPGSGDELQGIKRGIMEIADIVVINKADGAMADAARVSVRQYRNALHMLGNKHEAIPRKAIAVSALEHLNIDKLWNEINHQLDAMSQNGSLSKLRVQQDIYWTKQYLHQKTIKYFDRKISSDAIQSDLQSSQSPMSAADHWFDQFISKTKD